MTAHPNFFGTSAATPHAAGIAALMLQADPTATPAQIYSSLRSSALPMSTPTPNFSSGYGFIQADAALVIPTLSLSVPSIALGSTATLTWTSSMPRAVRRPAAAAEFQPTGAGRRRPAAA